MAAPFEPSPIWFGYYFDTKTEKADREVPLDYGGERHVLLFGVNGAGKSTRFLIENLCTLKNRSIVVLDLGKGELTRQTIRARRKICGAENVKVIDPDGITGLPSDGHNPLGALDDNDDLSDRAALLADAMVEHDGKESHWSESAQGLLQAGIMWEVIEAKREGRPPSLFRVRQLLTEPDEWERNPDGKTETQVKGLAVNAAKMLKEGGDIIASLVGRFLRKYGQNELSGIQSTFDTQTRFLLSPRLARDLEKTGADFRQLIKVPTTIYICLKIQEVSRKRRWTRMLITEALCEHFKPGDVNTLFILDEFRSSVGDLAIVRDVWALVRGFGIQLMPIVQSVVMLQKLFDTEFENFPAQCGVVATLGAPNDRTSARWMSERSGTTTIIQEAWNSGETVNPQGFSSNDGTGLQQVERPFLLPQELMNMPKGTGRMWLPGMGDRSIPYFAPNYWNRAHLKGLVDRNPLFKGKDASARRTSAPSVFRRLGIGLGVAAMIAAGALVGLPAISSGGGSPVVRVDHPPKAHPPAHHPAKSRH